MTAMDLRPQQRNAWIIINQDLHLSWIALVDNTNGKKLADWSNKATTQAIYAAVVLYGYTSHYTSQSKTATTIN